MGLATSPRSGAARVLPQELRHLFPAAEVPTVPKLQPMNQRHPPFATQHFHRTATAFSLMDAQAIPPPGLPRANPTVSYWQKPESSLAHHRSTDVLPATADVVIIGSGITGASAAFHLLTHPSPPASVVLLEARAACSGATGRNGGHTKHASYGSFLNTAETFGTEEAVRIARYEYACMKAMHATARELGIACDSWQGRTVDLMYDNGECERAKRSIAALQEALGRDNPAAHYTFWGAEAARTEFLAPGAAGAVTYEAGSMSGYKFVTGVLSVAVQKGLNLQTETPALALRKAEEGSWEVETPRGTVRAARVMLATNGYSAHLLPQLQGTIVPRRGHMSAQRPGSGLPRNGLGATYSYVSGDRYEYMIQRPPGTTDANMVMIGGCSIKALSQGGGAQEWGSTDDTVRNELIVKLLEACTKEYFGENWGEDHPDGRMALCWTGIMGFSADDRPFVGEIPGETNLFISASFQGQGMVLCWLAAKHVARMMLGPYGADESLIPNAFLITSDRLGKKFEHA